MYFSFGGKIQLSLHHLYYSQIKLQKYKISGTLLLLYSLLYQSDFILCDDYIEKIEKFSYNFPH
ncbi:hypothetical protein BpHYR1_011904 [Brachionus plicatilis]|uniref:Uncharacterized protein n=1 Tax=Brachionus plicatilis TaxID=10195 RepID=A0A3M7SQI6_BRAPC|nr:hypothetical protein BpHYR1_011904 [Brachionus plicatilis]